MRTLRPGPRPIFAFGILWLLIAALLFAVAAAYRRPFFPVLEGLGYLAAVFAAVVGSIYLQRIVVDDDSVALGRPVIGLDRVHFRDIAFSRSVTIAERDHPVLLDIYVTDPKDPSDCVLKLRLRLKPYRRQDVAWLLKLPQLKVGAPDPRRAPRE